MKFLNGNIKQLNIGDLQGTLFNSFNCDLSFNVGKICIAPRTILTDSAISDVPVGFKYFDGKWWTVAGNYVYYNAGSPTNNFAQDGSSGIPTNCSSDYSDIETFGSVLMVSSVDTLKTKVSNGSGTGAWTSRRTFSGASGQNHPLCSYNNRAYWLDIDSTILSMDTAYTVATSGSYTLALPSEYKVLWMRSFSNGIYIGTMHKYNGEALVFEWDGVTQNKWNRAYKVFAQGALAGYVSEDIPYVVNTNGSLLQFTGSGFKEVGRLPLKRNILYKATENAINNRFIHPNGLCQIDGRISFLINAQDNNTTNIQQLENIHSGIWEFNGTSLYHKYSLSYYTGSTISDYGQIRISRAGALAETPDMYATAESQKGNFLAGAAFFTDATTIDYGVWTDSYYDSVQKAGFFSTVQIRAQHFKEMWEQVALLYIPKPNFKFVVKYRIERQDPTDFNITWVSTNSFTTTQTSIAVGDEITIIQGTGSGRCAHVTSVTGSSTYTVTIDETLANVTGTARARKENWTKIGEITSTNQKYQECIISQPDTLIEIKVAMLGLGEVSVDEIILDNTKYQ